MSPGHDSHDSGRWRSPGAERWWECKGQRRRICSRPREAGSHGDRGAGRGWGGGLPGSGGEGARGRQPWEGGPARSRKMAAAATPPCPARAPGASPATLCSGETEAGRGTRERSPWTLRDAAGRGGPGIAGGRGWRRVLGGPRSAPHARGLSRSESSAQAAATPAPPRLPPTHDSGKLRPKAGQAPGGGCCPQRSRSQAARALVLGEGAAYVGREMSSGWRGWGTGAEW